MIKKNQLKQQNGNFKAEGSEIVDKTFNRLQSIVSHLEFMDVPIEKDDLNQKFLTSLAPEWLMYTIVWRNRDDLDTMSLDDLYNHLKVYEPGVQKKAGSNSQNMAFISSSNTSSGKGKVPTASVPTASSQVSTVSTEVAAASLSYDTICAYIATQRLTDGVRRRLTVQSTKKSKIEEERKLQKDPWVEEPMIVSSKQNLLLWPCLAQAQTMRIRVLERDVEIRDNKIESLKNELEELKKEKESIDHKLVGFGNALKDLNDLLKSQKSAKDKTGLPEFVDDIVTDYTRPTPSVDVSKDVRSDLDGNNTSIFKQGETSGSNMSRPMIKFVKESGCPNAIKINNTKNTRKPTVKYAEMYRDTSKSPKVRGNQRNWNNLKSQQLGKDFLMQNKACYKCGYFDHFGNLIVGSWVAKGRNLTKPTGAADLGNKGKAVKGSARWIWKPKENTSSQGSNFNGGNIDDKGYWDSGCSRHMTGNISYLSKYEPYDGGYVSFGYGGGKITGKGTIKTGKLEFENVYFVKELKYNLFSVSQICDNKNSVLFIDLECLVLGKDFKVDDSHVLLRTPRQHNMYSIDLNNIVPYKNLTCLIAKASMDESMMWHRRLGHLNFKTMNKLARNNLVRGLPSKSFENDHICVACLKGKQHKASCKTKLVNSVSKLIHTLHIDLFGPTPVSSLNHKWYCLVVTDNFSRFTWTFFLKSKDETCSIIRNLITEIENLKDLKVKIIRCDNGGEFKNREMDEFSTKKAVSTACYVQNRVLVNKSQNKTPYELFNGRSPAIGFLRPFGCHVMILNTLDHLGKFDAKGDEGYFVGYSLSSKAFRVFNKRTKKVGENLHVDFLENKPIEKGAGPNWLFDIDSLTNSMNYVSVVVAGTLILAI
ncbi:putative ribonuclease H-like domain-containing protein [Tanacetum coccineum]